MSHSRNSATDEPIEAIFAAANVLLRVAARSVIEIEDKVSSTQLRVLVFLALQGPQSAGAIARELAVHASNATRVCDRLTGAGLVERNADEADRRFVRMKLTALGRQLVDGVFDRRRAAIAEVVGAIPAPERAMVSAAFREFAAAADLEGATDGRFALGTR